MQFVHALRGFYERHPEYRQNPLWVTGESYAGEPETQYYCHPPHSHHRAPVRNVSRGPQARLLTSAAATTSSQGCDTGGMRGKPSGNERIIKMIIRSSEDLIWHDRSLYS